MTKPADTPRPLTDYQEDELIVGYPHARLVLDELDRHGVPLGLPENAPGLGLTRVRLDAAQAATRLPDTGSGGRSPATPPGREMSALETVLHRLRRRFAARYQGWWPTIGKNRVVGPVSGTYVIFGGGSAGRPEPLPGARLRPRAGTPGDGIRVGVADTRLHPHPWLAGGYLAAAEDLIDGTAAAGALSGGDWPLGHATFVTGLILQYAPGATVSIHPCLSGAGTADSWSVARTLVDAARDGLDLLNLSLGCYTEDGAPPLVLDAALRQLPPSTVVVAAAGNDGTGDPTVAPRPMWPAAFERVVSVGAVDGDGKRPDWSPDAPWVDVAGSGVAVTSTYLADGGLARWSGTSFAAAAVTGALAAEASLSGSVPQALHSLLAGADRDADGRPILATTR